MALVCWFGGGVVCFLCNMAVQFTFLYSLPMIISRVNQLIVFDVWGWIQGSLASSQCIREGCGFCYQKNYLKKWLLQEKWVYKKERAKKIWNCNKNSLYLRTLSVICDIELLWLWFNVMNNWTLLGNFENDIKLD